MSYLDETLSELQVLPLLLRLHALSGQAIQALLPAQAQAVPDHRHGRPNVLGLYIAITMASLALRTSMSY